MCNYAVNSITFSSHSLLMLKGLHKKVLACYDAMADGHNLVKDLMKAHGYPVPFGVNNTDHFSACDEFITNKKGVYYFQCETTSAWDANMEPFIKLLRERYSNKVQLSFCSEEQSNDIFLVKDDTGVFYPERFKVDWCIGDNYETQYFNTFSELFDYLKEMFPKAHLSYYDTLEGIKDSIDLAYENKDEEYFFYVYRFRDYYNEYENYIMLREAA